MQSRIVKIESLVEKAALRAQASGRAVLVSFTETVDPIGPLEALEGAVARIGSDPAARALLGGERMYWERPNESFILAAIGSVRTLDYSGLNRFDLAAQDWREILENAVVHGSDSIDSGPLLMGGFSFEPDGPRTQLWSGFTGASLVVPRILVSSVDGICRLTVNLVVSPDGRADAASDVLSGLADSIITASDEAGFSVEEGESELTVANLATRGEWQETVRAAITEIRSGRMDKVVLARGVRITAPDVIDVFALLRHLRSIHSASVVFGVWKMDRVFTGASPERLVRLTDREVEASSLAGTIERGAGPLEDAENARLLRESSKDLAEHAAVRDELYAALARTCDDVRAAGTPSLLTLPHVHHLHTALHARLREGGSLLDLVAQLHPTPAVGGSPRDPALRFIEQNENLDRGWYAAPVGWIGGKGGEFAVALRSALVDESEAVLFAGCGIVADSDPDLEFAESNLKLQAMKSAIAASVAPERCADEEMTIASEHST
jgi:isochorismate synthase